MPDTIEDTFMESMKKHPLHKLTKLEGLITSGKTDEEINEILGFNINEQHTLAISYRTIKEVITHNEWDESNLPKSFNEFTAKMSPANKAKAVAILALYAKDLNRVTKVPVATTTQEIEQAMKWVDAMIKGIDDETEKICIEFGIDTVSRIELPSQTKDIRSIIARIASKALRIKK